MQLKNPLPFAKHYEAAEVSVVADEAKIEQVMDNLSDEQHQIYREQGEIAVTVREARTSDKALKNAGAEKPSIVVCVKDNGLGIPAKEIPFIFDKYRQIVTSAVTAGKGTGLGLAICRHC